MSRTDEVASEVAGWPEAAQRALLQRVPLYRLFQGQLVMSRPMTAEERQEELKFSTLHPRVVD